MPLRRDGHALYRQYAQVGLQLAAAQGMLREHGDAQAARHGLLDGLVATQLQPGRGLETLGCKEPVGGQPRARSALAQHKALVAQVRQRNAAALGQRVALPGDEHQRVGQKTWSSRSMSGGGKDITYRSSMLSRRRCTTPSRLSTSSAISMSG